MPSLCSPGSNRCSRSYRSAASFWPWSARDSVSNVRRALGKQAALISQFACGASLFGKAAKFKAVLKRTGITAPDALCIGDEVRDGEAARQAGIDFGAVCWGYAKPEALQQASPVLVFESVADIARLI